MKLEINGLPVEAEYTQESIDSIFLPLVETLTALQKQKGRRILVFLAAPPAAGKSTLLAFLTTLSGSMTALGMDGFHRKQAYLLSHTTLRDGREVRMVDIKGAPETFDLDRLTAFVARAAAGEDFGWPVYDRLLHDPVEDAVEVRGDIILIEGNYLLLEQDGWRDLRSYADYTISITADESMLRGRLIDRKSASNPLSKADAEAFVDFSDMHNVRLCLAHSMPADLRLKLLETGEYIAL